MKKPKILAVVALNNFPMWGQTLRALSKVADGIVVRFDRENGDPSILVNQQIEHACRGKLELLSIEGGGWSVPEWRERCLRLLDEFEPDIVIQLDEDEMFGGGIEEEIDAFWRSDKQGMMFHYHPLESNDGREINDGVPYPPDPHMKVFKWEKELSFYPYHGDGKPSAYHDPKTWYLASTKIRHLSSYTPAMEATKRYRSDTPDGRGIKAVTLLGFGPTSKPPHGQDLRVSGHEIWSLNNCYETFPARTLRQITRVFEMHKFGPRQGGHWDDVKEWAKRREEMCPDEKPVLVDGELMDRNALGASRGKTHVQWLDEMGRNGARIVMQEEHPEITGSERFPLNQMKAMDPLGWYAGSPCYMIAQALMEGYNCITVYGFDQMDWEHIIQRECWIYWIGKAAGMGVQINGALSFRTPFTKDYGYDYGPEGGPYQERLLWLGHPMQATYKDPSRALRGDLFAGQK